MKYITKDEMYDWMPCSSKELADAQIPDDLDMQLHDAIAMYRNVCNKIREHLRSHEDDEFRI